MQNKKTVIEDWGLIDFKEAWDKQEAVFSSMVQQKSSILYGVKDLDEMANNRLVFCQHPHVMTLGKSGKENHLLLDVEALKQKGVGYYHINRGGDITYHGPGQLLCYPLLDLDNFFTDLHCYMRTLEEAVIRTLKEYGLSAGRYNGFTGVWFDANTIKARKIAAMGVRCSRWVVMHGLSFNINPDLSYFKDIVPCGISDKPVTSMEAELGYKVDMIEVQNLLQKHLVKLFEMDIKQ
ncbi:lipoyl(octanoyl) transferase LipB [Sphingobacterium multivorum]|uniref:lipoyl(octanoyl) transferase LipB n=1 Tax=Sphingobacterium multivorum TaxID=28454 RepID=UPI00345E8974